MASVWLSTLRVRTLGAATAPVLVGAAYAFDGTMDHVVRIVAALAAALLLQIGTNLANDYFDAKKGADTPDRAGPQRASATGALKPSAVRNAAAVVFALAGALGIYLGLEGGLPIFLIGGSGILLGYAYTAGPKPLAYVGLGDLVVFVYFGPLATMGMAILLGESNLVHAALLGVPLGLLAAAILVVNNVRDRPTDERVGKRTLPVRLGDTFGVQLYQGCVTMAFAWVAGLVYVLGPWLLLPLLAYPLAQRPRKRMAGKLDPRKALNPALGETNKLLLAFALLLTIGVYLA